MGLIKEDTTSLDCSSYYIGDYYNLINIRV